MSTDLVPVTDWTAELDRVADPGAFVIASVDRAKHWLTEALIHGDIAAIVELKSQAEAIRVYSMSKQLGKDAELAAAEIVRRAERGLHLAVDRGRELGQILRPGQTLRRPGHQVANDNPVKSLGDVGVDKIELANTRDLTDDVTDDEFEEAITEARAEGNLSRANVVRKVKKEELPVSAPVPAQIFTAAAQRRAFAGACTTLAGVAMGLRQIQHLHSSITNEEAAEWVDGLSEARVAIERAIKRLKERANSVPQA